MGSTTAQNFEQVTYGGTASQHRGNHRAIIGDAVATRTLVPKESGALCLLDRAAGVVYTLPTPVIGMQFEFVATVSVTSNAYKIVTASTSTQFLLGEIAMISTATASPAGFAANGTNIAALSANGSTTGGLIGERYKVTAISATQWFIEGVCVGSGTLATPFAAS